MMLFLGKLMFAFVVFKLLVFGLRKWTSKMHFRLNENRFFIQCMQSIYRQLVTGRVMTTGISKRAHLFNIGAMQVANIWIIILSFLYAVALCWWGLLAGLQNVLSPLGQPTALLLLLTEPSPLALLFCFLIGVGIGMLLPWRGLSMLIAVAFGFTYFLTLPGAVLLVFGEFAVGLNLHRAIFGHGWHRAWYGRAIVGVLAALVFWMGGGVLRPAFVELGFDTQVLLDRCIEFVLLLLVITFTDSCLALFFLHFGWTLDRARAFLTDDAA